MHSPYTSEPLEAFMAAETAVAATLTALVWHRPFRRLGSAFVVVAIWLAALAPVEGTFLRGIGFEDVMPGHDRIVYVLRAAALLAAMGAILSGRLSVALVGVISAVFLYWLHGFVLAADWDLAAADLAAFGLLVGVNARDPSPTRAPPGTRGPPLSFGYDDWTFFALAVSSAAIVSTVVLHRLTDSADEWSYTYQAAVFAKGRAYADAPPCWYAFQNFWVFESAGRNFSQYTPGWPLFMTPFFLLHVVWLAGPFSFGLLVVGVARLARRAAAGFSAGSVPPAPSRVRAAGWIAALVTTFGTTTLVNGASRFPHVLVAATFAFAVDALCAMTDPGLSHDEQWSAGLLCGAAAMTCVATRPPDGVLLGFGLFVYAVYALAQRRLPLRAVTGTLGSFAVVGGATLVILHAQLGAWFRTGYSLNAVFHPWNKFGFSPPHRNELNSGIPLATGSYCWWPCAPAVGLAGMALVRGRARRIAVIFFCSVVPFLVFYESLTFGRHDKFGYGPRFQLPLVVPMAVGAGVALAPLWHTARSRWRGASGFRLGGPASVAIFAAIVGFVRIGALIFPYTHQSVMAHDRLHEAIEKAHLQNAVVFGARGLNNTDVRDLTENLPLALYPNQPAIVANQLSSELGRCVRRAYPNRVFYQAIPSHPIRMQRLP